MPLYEEFINLPNNEITEIIQSGSLTEVIDLFTKTLENISPSIRPRTSTNQPGAVFHLSHTVEQVLYFGDLHPSRKSVHNVLKALQPYFTLLQAGRLGLVLAGDFTHPAEDDLTDMEPSLLLLRDVLIPLKALFPNNVVLLRGDHETVGSPYGEDFGKGTDFLPDWTLDGGLENLIKSELIWAIGPNKPEFAPSSSRFTGIYNNSPLSERYTFTEKRFGRDTYHGSWHSFERIQVEDEKRYLIFGGSTKRPDPRKVRIEQENDHIRFFLEEEERDVLCSLALNQSRAYGMYLERCGGKEVVQKLQIQGYDLLPLIISGICFVGIHGSPIEKLSPNDDQLLIQPLTKEEIVELSNPDFRAQMNSAYRRLIFGRPIEGESFTFTPKIVENFLQTLGNDPKDLFLMAHTRPDHFLENYVRVFSTRNSGLLLNKDVYAPFGPEWNHIIIDSQSVRCSHLVIQHRRPDLAQGEQIRDLVSLKTIVDT